MNQEHSSNRGGRRRAGDALRRGALTITAALALSGAALVAQPAPAAADVVEPSSGAAFPETRSVGGKTYQLVGTGLRKKFVIKVYAMGLYLEQAGAKQAYAGGAGSGPQAFVIGGGFGKVMALRFLRDVDKGKIQDAYKESLQAALSGPTAADAQAFINLFDRDVKQGQELLIQADEGGKLSVSIAGQRKEGPQSPALAKAVWEIWLGNKPIAPDAKKTLVERLGSLK